MDCRSLVLKKCLFFFITILVLFSVASAEDLEKKDGIKSPIKYILDVPHDYLGYAKEAVKRDYVKAYLIGAGVIGASMLLDDSIRNYFQSEHPLSDIEWLGNDYLGSARIYNALYAGMCLSGYALDKKGFVDTAVMGFEKMILDMNILALLKNNVNRRRPNESNYESFTSGHTTPPASFASTISTMSDWDPWVTGISYSISIFTGLCRIETDQHWFSDIVGTHVLTTLTAIPMSKYWKSKNVIILPNIIDGKTGFIMVLRVTF